MNKNYEIIELPEHEYNKLYCNLLYYYYYYKYELNEGTSTIFLVLALFFIGTSFPQLNKKALSIRINRFFILKICFCEPKFNQIHYSFVQLAPSFESLTVIFSFAS